MLFGVAGAGIIGLPFAVRECGLVLGIFLLFLVMFLTYFSVKILVTLGLQTGRRGYEDLMQYCFGYKGFLLISFFMATFAFGAMCSYLIIIGHTVPPVLESATGEWDQRCTQVTYVYVVELRLRAYRHSCIERADHQRMRAGHRPAVMSSQGHGDSRVELIHLPLC